MSYSDYKTILVMGLPGSGKSFLSERLSQLIGAVWLNADKVRKEANDWDFSENGRLRQSKRMRILSEELKKKGNHVIADFVCPTKKTREDFNPDYIIWMDTIKKSRYEDTNQLFERPDKEKVNFIVREKNTDSIKFIAEDLFPNKKTI